MDNHLQRVSELLLNNRGEVDSNFWGWLKPNQRVSLKDANKFMLASILDYQMHSRIAWQNAQRLAEDILKNPDKLWHEITSITLEEWKAKRVEYSLHRFPKGHERVWTIGERIVEKYKGDARKIWNNQSTDKVMRRFDKLGVGEQLSRMIVGALIDTGHISGRADVKADTHVRRVLGRVLQGHEFPLQDADKVVVLTREMHPDNPWLLDRPLYLLGKQMCQARVLNCEDCFLRTECVYNKRGNPE